MSSDTYVKRAIADVEQELEQIGKMLPTRIMTPLSQEGYHPEIDLSGEYDDK
jgi:hypothetical protein